MKRTSLLLGFYGLSVGIYAQQAVIIKEEKYSAPKSCATEHIYDKKAQLHDNFIYLNSDRETPKGTYDIHVISNETCKDEKKSKGLKFIWSAYPSFNFLVSPDKKMALALEYSQPNYGLPKFMGTHVINQNGDLVWSEEWSLKAGDAELEMISAGVDDNANALFFVRAKQKEGTSHAIVYRNAETGKYKIIPYSLDVNGRVTFRANFDDKGNIHFMGAFSRRDSKETGETKRGVFHGKVDPKSEGSLNTTLYPFEETGRFDSEWKLKDYFVDEEGNITLCALGQYAKSGAGRDFSKLFILQLDNEGKEKWSHVITTVNLMREPTLGEGRFCRFGNSYGYIYFDNADYIKYTNGIDPKEVSSEPKLNELQMYLVDASGKLSKKAVAPIEMFRKNTGPGYKETEDALYVTGKDTDKKITW